ncbi:MAG: GrpB family protein [Geodermatophilaceae bacterium]|nr:GrpB family protein [Geodermatophilaceae bacterium]
MAGAPVPSSAAVLRDWDPGWPSAAGRLLRRLRQTLAGGDGTPYRFDHIGSTSVPGLEAKPILDLQIVVAALPDDEDALRRRLLRVGFLPARGARPDSPGVNHDGAPGGAVAQLPKRLFHCPDPGQPAILHIRLAASPFAEDSLRFRDRLTADPAYRARYAELKARLADAHRGDGDYDDYTHGKSAFIGAALGPARR